MGWIKKLLSGVLLGLFIAALFEFIFLFISLSYNYFLDFLIISVLIILIIGLTTGILFAFLYKREWPSWLKGGIIGTLIIIFIIIIYFGLDFLVDEYGFEVSDTGMPSYNNFGELLREINRILGKVFAFPNAQILDIIYPCSLDYTCLYLIIPLLIIQYFIVGSLIGFIIGKFKSKNQTQI